MSFTGNVSFVYGEGLGSTLGKKGTVSDVTLYNVKVGDTILSFVEASGFPEKIQPLTTALMLSQQAVLKVSALTPDFAEVVVVLGAAGLTKGCLILDGTLTHEQIAPLVKGTVIEGYEVVSGDVVPLRERLAADQPQNEGPCLVQVDHSFSVKGVGTVSLGVVKQGVVKKYDTLRVYPGDKRTVVKSMQVHDVDQTEAGVGVRVGLCIKDVKPEDVQRGSILSITEDLAVINELSVHATLSKYAGRPLTESDIVTATRNLTYTPATVTQGTVAPGQSGNITLTLEKPLVATSERILLLDPAKKPPRILGYATAP